MMPSDTTQTTDVMPAKKPAKLWKRLMAMVYDSFPVLAISMGYGALATIMGALLTPTDHLDYSPTVGGWLFQLGWIASIAIFFGFFWSHGGQTIGMKAWRLQLVSSNSRPLGIARALMRFAIGILSFGCGGACYWWMLIDRDGLALHDRLTATQIIARPKP